MRPLPRRDFLKLAGLAGAGAALGVAGGAAPARASAAPAARPARVRYPRPLRPGDTIGVTAPSAGVGPDIEPRLAFCLDFLRAQGYRVRLGECLLGDGIVSAPAADRAAELTRLLLDDGLSAVMPPWGGEILIDIIPLLDFRRLANGTPKWFVGYSDLATFMFPYTLLTGIATLHGSCLLEAPIDPPAPSLAWWGDVVRLARGASFTQRAADLYQDADVDWAATPRATSFARTAPVAWKVLGHEDDERHRVSVRGRLIGGTLDVIGSLPATGWLDAFARTAAPEGLILYFDDCDMQAAQYCRMLHHLRLSGWFRHVNAVLAGRTAAADVGGFTPRDALADALGGLGVPVVYDVDIGHLPPQLTLVNGALATLAVSGAGRSLTQVLA